MSVITHGEEITSVQRDVNFPHADAWQEHKCQIYIRVFWSLSSGSFLPPSVTRSHCSVGCKWSDLYSAWHCRCWYLKETSLIWLLLGRFPRNVVKLQADITELLLGGLSPSCSCSTFLSQTLTWWLRKARLSLWGTPGEFDYVSVMYCNIQQTHHWE